MGDNQQQAARKLAQEGGRAIQKLGHKNPIAAGVLAAAIVLLIVAFLIMGATSGSSGASSGGSESATIAQTTEESSSNTALEQAEVERVVDGDTLKVKTANDTDVTVRLIGMDTPESVAQEESRNCEEGVIAANYTKSLVSPGQTIWLSRDVSDTDQYGRLLRYVWLERPNDPSNEDEIANKMLNAILVREGYAQVKRYNPDTTLYELFRGWGQEALEAGKGVTHKWA